MSKDEYFEEFYETSPLVYLPLNENNTIVEDNGKVIETRHIIRYLKGHLFCFIKILFTITSFQNIEVNMRRWAS